MRGELYIMTMRGRGHYIYISITYFSKKRPVKAKNQQQHLFRELRLFLSVRVRIHGLLSKTTYSY